MAPQLHWENVRSKLINLRHTKKKFKFILDGVNATVGPIFLHCSRKTIHRSPHCANGSCVPRKENVVEKKAKEYIGLTGETSGAFLVENIDVSKTESRVVGPVL